jgi:hypothetical protein
MRDTSTWKKLNESFGEQLHMVPSKQNIFFMILDALASDGFSSKNVFSVFETLFECKKLSDCRRALMWVPGY